MNEFIDQEQGQQALQSFAFLHGSKLYVDLTRVADWGIRDTEFELTEFAVRTHSTPTAYYPWVLFTSTGGAQNRLAYTSIESFFEEIAECSHRILLSPE